VYLFGRSYSETIVVGRTRVAATEHELRVHAELFVALFNADAVTLFGPIVSIHPEMWGLLLVKEQERSACTNHHAAALAGYPVAVTAIRYKEPIKQGLCNAWVALGGRSTTEAVGLNPRCSWLFNRLHTSTVVSLKRERFSR
jgi:hypothetical protein